MALDEVGEGSQILAAALHYESRGGHAALAGRFLGWLIDPNRAQ